MSKDDIFQLVMGGTLFFGGLLLTCVFVWA